MHEQAIKTFGEAERLLKDDPKSGWGLARAYNSGCMHSLLGKKQEAMASLRKAARLGFRDIEHLRNDPDLESVRAEQEYLEIVATIEQNAAGAGAR